MPVADSPVSIVYPHLLQDKAVTTSFEHLSLEGLPEGSKPAQIVRCIQLLEHVANCGCEPDKCPEGEGCQRTRRVLAHHFACSNMRRGEKDECNICCQLLALCRNHSNCCKAGEGNCPVPYCKNKKLKAVPQPNKSQSNVPTENRSKGEYQYVIRKLAEAMAHPMKHQKLRGIKCLLETNRQATIQVLRYIIGKKQKSQPVPLHQKMQNLTIGEGIKPIVNLQKEINLMMQQPAARTCILKLVVSKVSLSERYSSIE